ncbi:RICIN domain-containing protein [Actinoplanes sp. NPDC049265]|uniref:RICIN domain-containing protein n=1 Tax=Actinoplanes sp. NPDC049265 TaxID=3363902 RepID=UPI003719E04F
MFRRILSRRRTIAGAALVLAVLVTLSTSVAQKTADAAEPLAGSRVSGADLRTLNAAAGSCPALSPARLAGQVMAASQFSSTPVEAMRAVGAKGPAALTPQVWDKWAPWAGARPTDREASITALAHDMCQLVGQIRVVKIDGDQWQLALAAHRVGMEAVVSAGDVPAGAKEYVGTVERYASWYALQPEFGGSGQAAPADTADPQVNDAPVVPVPDHLVPGVLAAGKVCPELPPAKIAAQVMATSGFDEQKLGPAGEQGIAQFLPQTWTKYVPPSDSSSPWDARSALPALGTTMCALVKSTKSYPEALAAYAGGGNVGPLVGVVDRDTAEYAKDARLQLPPVVTPPAPPTKGPDLTELTRHGTGHSHGTTAGHPVTGKHKAPTKAKHPAPKKKKTTTKKAKPPAKTTSTNGKGKTLGPYFVFNYGTGLCVDPPGVGAGPKGGRIDQNMCIKTAADNQEFTFVPRGKDGSGRELYWIRNVSAGFCVDPPGAGSAAPLAQLSYSSCLDRDNQYFRLEPTFKAGGFQYYWLVNSASGLCVDVPGVRDPTVTLRLELWHCVHNDDQDWTMVRKSQW